ncbi:MAG: guanylate kinase [Bdellovibrionaceae bacterium]|jgi:guanylate kinase|nr:guanylate kinase [Pseudobdellovibrionaceae bacterium]
MGNQKNNGKMIIVAGPSGVGKSSFVDKIIDEIPGLTDVVTYTTRAIRPGEIEGVAYHFVTKDQFEKLIVEDFFVEWANVHTNIYGTPFNQIYDAWEKSDPVIMDIDVQGAETFREKFSNCFTIFIHPPSVDALRQRVLSRDKDKVKDLDVRMENAKKEIAQSHLFHSQLVNDNFEDSYKEFKKIVVAYIKAV